MGFQPTRPLRGATVSVRSIKNVSPFQPTRPLRGATCDVADDPSPFSISTHAPLAGRDPISVRSGTATEIFQPTRPLRGATMAIPLPFILVVISTHAPLAGRDQGGAEKVTTMTNFNPRAPCGARPKVPKPKNERLNFNPRAPCGARQQKCTNHYAHFCDNRQISDAFAQNAACQGILLLFDAGKSCGFWVRTAQVISAHLCFAL